MIENKPAWGILDKKTLPVKRFLQPPNQTPLLPAAVALYWTESIRDRVEELHQAQEYSTGNPRTIEQTPEALIEPGGRSASTGSNL